MKTLKKIMIFKWEIFKKLAKSGIKVAIARCYAFVGKYLPRESNYVIGNFIQNILNKQNIEVKSNYHIIRLVRLDLFNKITS